MVADEHEFEIEVPVKAAGERVIKRVSLGRLKTSEAAKKEPVIASGAKQSPSLSLRAERSNPVNPAGVAELVPSRGEGLPRRTVGVPRNDMNKTKPVSTIPELVPEERVMVVPQPSSVRRQQRTGPPELVHDLTAPAPMVVPPVVVAARNRQADVYGRLADEIIRQSGATVATEVVSRLRSAILARLKDVRDAIETREVLSRLVPNDIERLSTLIESKAQGLLGELQKIQKEKTTDALKREADDTASRAARRDEDEEQARQQIYEAITGLKAKAKRNVEVARVADVAQAAQGTKVAVAAKVTVQDVLAPRSAPLVGPLQELSSLSLADFRRLSKNSREASAKIRDKVKLLSEQSITEGFSGVKAWQQSEPFRLYQDILNESLTSKKQVPAVLTDRAVSGKPTLTSDEFSAILELNTILRKH